MTHTRNGGAVLTIFNSTPTELHDRTKIITLFKSSPSLVHSRLSLVELIFIVSLMFYYYRQIPIHSLLSN